MQIKWTRCASVPAASFIPLLFS